MNSEKTFRLIRFILAGAILGVSLTGIAYDVLGVGSVGTFTDDWIGTFAGAAAGGFTAKALGFI